MQARGQRESSKVPLGLKMVQKRHLYLFILMMLSAVNLRVRRDLELRNVQGTARRPRGSAFWWHSCGVTASCPLGVEELGTDSIRYYTLIIPYTCCSLHKFGALSISSFMWPFSSRLTAHQLTSLQCPSQHSIAKCCLLHT